MKRSSPRKIATKNGLQKRRFTVIVSKFNSFITEHMLQNCLRAFKSNGVSENQVRILRVPGSLEIPVALKKVLEKKQDDAVICFGCIIRGETSHYDHVASETARGIAELSRNSGVPVIFGVITAENLAQALERAGGKMGNKGAESAAAALEMANLLDNI